MTINGEIFEGIRVVLASQSPRRKELLSMLCDSFEVLPADIDESVPEGVKVQAAAEYTAEKKAAAIEAVCSDALIVACDTVVIVGDEIMGKPADRDDGRRMLRLLSGRAHEVISGVAIKYMGETRRFSQTTRVTFYDMSDSEINAYLDSGEPFDKAGAYGIQGLGGVFVKEIEGDYFNVVGLPIARLRQELIRLLHNA